jgi:6-phosphofructokinase 1
MEPGDGDIKYRRKTGIGEAVSAKLRELSPKYNGGKRVNVISQSLGYLVRSGAPDFIDSIVPIAFANVAFDLIDKRQGDRLVRVKNGKYGDAPLEIVEERKKTVNVDKYYSVDRCRPLFTGFADQPLMIMPGDI